jgi:hypothetical protein
MSVHGRFNKHSQSFRNNNSNSRFPQLLHEMGHSLAPVEEIMGILHVVNKGNDMDTFEKHHIYLALL